MWLNTKGIKKDVRQHPSPLKGGGGGGGRLKGAGKKADNQFAAYAFDQKDTASSSDDELQGLIEREPSPLKHGLASPDIPMMIPRKQGAGPAERTGSAQLTKQKKLPVVAIPEGDGGREELLRRKRELQRKQQEEEEEAEAAAQRKKQKVEEEEEAASVNPPPVAAAAAAAAGAPKGRRVRRQRDDDSSDEEDVFADPSTLKKKKAAEAAAAAAAAAAAVSVESSEDELLLLLDGDESSREVEEVKKKPAPAEFKPEPQQPKKAPSPFSLSSSEDEKKEKLVAIKKEKKEKVVEEIEDSEEEDDGGSDWEDEESVRAEKTVKACELISKRLMDEIKNWGAQHAEDRLDLTHMDDDKAVRPSSSSSSTSSSQQKTERVRADLLAAACPGVVFKPYQLVGINWLFLLHQLDLHLPRDLLPKEVGGWVGERKLRRESEDNHPPTQPTHPPSHLLRPLKDGTAPMPPCGSMGCWQTTWG